MGCFLACFGLSKKRKRRKTLYKVLAAPGHQNYVALDSSVIVNLATPDNSIIPYSNFRDECKEQARPKSRKKVSFNLNVQIYEPNPYQILESDEEEENKKDNGETEKSSSSSSILGENSAALNYPSNYRYYNCLDSCNEDDEIENEASDIDAYDDEDDEFDDEDGWDCGNSSGSEDEDRSKVYKTSAGEKQCSEPIYSLEEDREKSHMHSVLRPVENITQWKAIKAQVASNKHRRKENVPLEQKTSITLLSEPGFNLLESNVSKPLLTEIAVDASLSNWLIPPCVSKTTIHCQ
ncbi:uncharacterized protein LOC129309337 [Prosopis cineraria]|uniref:uncharacterized protein LOC129309337 n=1 Tax=Prosopis cineraria TaxID=364024 RepID=UPI00240F71A4|nr:uncharacterized protein LOC129309337 [Prosopis cineraria]